MFVLYLELNLFRGKVTSEWQVIKIDCTRNILVWVDFCELMGFGSPGCVEFVRWDLIRLALAAALSPSIIFGNYNARPDIFSLLVISRLNFHNGLPSRRQKVPYKIPSKPGTSYFVANPSPYHSRFNFLSVFKLLERLDFQFVQY